MRDEWERLPNWVVEALRRPVTPPGDGPARVMARVRAAAAAPRRRWRVETRRRRGAVPLAFGLAVAAGVAVAIVGAATLRAVSRWQHPVAAHGITVLADSAGRVRVPRAAPAAAVPAATAADDTRVSPPLLRHDSL